MIGPDKEIKILKNSHLMEVEEFHKMVVSLQRFKEDLAVKALTGKKNIRTQQTPDRIFFSVLEKMLLEVSGLSSDLPTNHKMQQQLLSLQKVFAWFQSNKHVLVKSDGFFKSAKKITEDIYEKKMKSFHTKRALHRRPFRGIRSQATPLRSIESHLARIQQEQQDADSRAMLSGTSMFAPSPTQDLTSIDSATIADKGYYQEELDFAREIYEHEYMGGNRIERLNRPRTAPLKMKPQFNTSTSTAGVSSQTPPPTAEGQNVQSARPQSAILQVRHDLSWAKLSPMPLSVLIRKNAEEANKELSPNGKKMIKITMPLADDKQASSEVTKKNETRQEHITDQSKFENLILFKQFCLQHAAQQENYMRQYTSHKHGTRQHFLEFPENKTENVVRSTASDLYSRNNHQTETTTGETKVGSMGAYKGMSLVEFLDLDTGQPVAEHIVGHTAKKRVIRPGSTNVSNFNADQPAVKLTYSKNKVPQPPQRPLRVVQPSHDPIPISSVYCVAGDAGRRMNAASDQALNAPKHGWRYPMVPISSNQVFNEEKNAPAAGVVLALQDESVVQHKVLIPLTSSGDAKKQVADQAVQTISRQEIFSPDFDASGGEFRPKSSYTNISALGSNIPSRSSTRPMSSPRYITEVRAIYRHNLARSRSSVDMRPETDFSDFRGTHRSLRSAGASGGASRPRTAASWGSYPARSEVTRSVGAASHSTGTLKHRSVAETMRVKSVNKVRRRGYSGRSSASSYAAQLREKKRAGGVAYMQGKPGPRKQVDLEQTFLLEEGNVHPQISFVKIVSPMHVPSDLSASAYARPGGVYCGSTAAVAIATEAPCHAYDDAMSDGHLSYEEYPVDEVEEASADEATKANEDNWLSQWLSGGPLEGLHNTANNGATATYADLVSRAAILDSSDERTYSEEALSSTGAAAEVDASPRDNFTLTPRSDPLISHRTTTTDGKTDDENIPSLKESQDVDSAQASSIRSDRSYVLSSSLSTSYQEEEKDIDTEEDLLRKSEGGTPDHLEEEEQVSDAADQTTRMIPEGVDDETALDATDAKDNDRFNGEDSDASAEESSKLIDDNDVDNSNPILSTEKFQEFPDDLLENGKQNKTYLSEENKVNALDNVTPDKCESVQVSPTPDEVTDDETSSLEPSGTGSETLNSTVKSDKLSSGDEQQPKLDEDSMKTTEVAKIFENADITPAPPGGDKEECKDESSYGSDKEMQDEVETSEPCTSVSSCTESETEILGENDACPIRIIVTSARTVEKELLEQKKFTTLVRKNAKFTGPAEDQAIQETTTSNNGQVKTVPDPSPSEEDKAHMIPNASDPPESSETLPSGKSELVSSQSLQQETNRELYAEDKMSHVITREEVDAVTSLARPLSRRPIPSVSEVKDPFVDLVASTRQRQIDRSVDVQTIFRGNVTGDAYKKFDLNERRIREEEQEAVLKMQRAYRHHLARKRAARKCVGMNKETLEWAKSYKAMLLAKKETRKRRLREARNSERTAHRRETQRMSRIGPHNEVYEIYHPGPELPDTELIQESAVEIQRMIRGWLLRIKLERVKQLVANRGSTLSSTVVEYRNLLQRTQTRHGKLKASLFLTYEELHDYLQQRAKYELIFKKREFWNEMESSELPAFFIDCGLFPSQDEINEAWEAVSKSMDFTRKKKKKHSASAMSLDDVIEVAFHIYVPSGARMEDQKTRLSTPIYGDEEGLKLLSGDEGSSDIEGADLEVVSRFVANTFKERQDEDGC